MVLRTIWASLVTMAACLLCSLFLHTLEPLCWVKYNKPPPAVSSISIVQRSHITVCFEESGCLVILSWIFANLSESLWVTNWGSEGWDMMVFEYETLIIFIDEDMHNLCTMSMSWACQTVTWSLSLIARSGSIPYKYSFFSLFFLTFMMHYHELFLLWLWFKCMINNIHIRNHWLAATW